ncbi:CIA30 family protein [Falsiruegeria litorea]|uniref:CIA30 family protein n=1 Tax=Falsiruegeria litorea TaxID=1280831 RepID=A0ABS5WSM1_9RHOB|nr:CIA30 family protein [Falsiruegeria litorea]MBT3142122.1 CIA30 family protein [Falsiruegeria litorea]MBT8168533.1 CIA30 family protein [Falsiruegeria litorea]
MSKLETTWEFVADTVMGGISSGQISDQVVGGRSARRLTGKVSLENNGGFIQMASDLKRDSSGLDANHWGGIQIDVFGNDETYDLRLRTDDLDRPWQSFRAPFWAPAYWTTMRFPFSVFVPHKTDKVLNPAKLRRIGIVAVGRVFQADIAVSDVRLF